MDFIRSIRSQLLGFKMNDDNFDETCELYNLVNDVILPVIKKELDRQVKQRKTSLEKIKNYGDYCNIRNQMFDNIMKHLSVSKEFYIGT